MTPRRILVLSPVLPYRNPNNAGARLVQCIHDALSTSGTELLCLVPSGDATEQARATRTAPRHLSMEGDRYRGGPFRQRARQWLLPVAPPAGFALSMLLRRDARRAVRSADVIDIQWLHFGSLLLVVSLLNRRAWTVVTVHDVLSQKFARERASAQGVPARLRVTWALWQARILEHFVGICADVVTVLSDKDRALFPGGRARVLLPPLAADAPDTERAPAEGRLLFVAAMYREENRDALRWFLEDMWPGVKDQHPTALLDVAGAGAGTELERLVHGSPGVRLLGFVADLEPLYTKASVVVVPLRRGAGVKFKVVDALVRGVPVVTTSVGAEGIGVPNWFAGVHDQPADFVRAIIEVLKFPEKYKRQASVVRSASRTTYGPESFRHTVREVYGIEPEGNR